LSPAGHKHHIYAISEIMRAGSIRNAVEQGVVTGGIMYECVKKGIPFVLAGSIRDDGPLPRHDHGRRRGAGCHAPSYPGSRDGGDGRDAPPLHRRRKLSPLIRQDRLASILTPASVTKLMDRGTTQAIGVVSDAGTFLPLLAKQLEEQKEKDLLVEHFI